MKAGIFGGTFNPIHYGHLRAAEEAREIIGLEKILFIPSGNPPLKDLDIADARQRYAMAEMAVMGNPNFDVLDIECSSPEKSYTVHTVERLNKIYAGSDLYFMLGIDAFMDMPNWYMPEKLVSIINFALLSRPNTRFVDLSSSLYLHDGKDLLHKLDSGELQTLRLMLESQKEVAMAKVTGMAISSTDIRDRVRNGESIKYLLPREVESFIILNKLYSENKTKGSEHP